MRNGASALLLAGFCLALAAPSRGQETPPLAPPPPAVPDDQQAETLDYQTENSRMTVPVSIGEHGPFRFVVDTGAERTVISRELASSLALAPGQTATVHSMTEVSRIATVVIPALRVGARSVADINAPALARVNLGASGILGVDTLQRQRVTFDFKRGEMTIMPSRRPEASWQTEGTVVVNGRSLFGRLVLVDASVDGQRVWVIIDTGSEVSVGNNALRRALERRHRLGAIGQARIVSVTGGVIDADYSVARRLRIGGIDITSMPIAFSDVHPFRQLQLLDRPALLLGMDALQLFERVSVDFANRRVRILLDDSSRLGGAPLRIAAETARTPGEVTPPEARQASVSRSSGSGSSRP